MEFFNTKLNVEDLTNGKGIVATLGNNKSLCHTDEARGSCL